MCSIWSLAFVQWKQSWKLSLSWGLHYYHISFSQLYKRTFAAAFSILQLQSPESFPWSLAMPPLSNSLPLLSSLHWFLPRYFRLMVDIYAFNSLCILWAPPALISSQELIQLWRSICKALKWAFSSFLPHCTECWRDKTISLHGHFQILLKILN